MKTIFAFLLTLILAFSLNSQSILAKWTFDGNTEPASGFGTASLIGGVTQHSATLSSGWRITDFPDQFTFSGTAGAQFMVSTLGFESIKLDFSHRASGTASRWAMIQYTIDGGENWIDFELNGGRLSPHDTEYPFKLDFTGHEGVDDNPDFGVRIVSIFSPLSFNPEVPDVFYGPGVAYHRARTEGTGGNEYAATGNWRLLNVVFRGAEIDKVREVITRWDFDDTTDPAEGNGVAALIGGVTQHSATLSNGWRISNFPDQFAASGTAGAEFMISTLGYEKIVLEFKHRSSGTASRWAELQYTTDGGENWIFYLTNDGALSPHDIVYPFFFDFEGVEGVNNNPDFGIRIVSIFSPVEFNPEVPDVFYGPDVAYHRARTEGTGGNEYSGDGNWRFLDVIFKGEIMDTDLPAVKLEIVSVNDELPVYARSPFHVLVYSLDENGVPSQLEQDTEVAITIGTGTGNLSGLTTATIQKGSSSVLLEGLLYDKEDNDVSLIVSADGLEDGESDLFDVLIRKYMLTIESNPPGAGTFAGEGEYEAGREVVVIAEANSGYKFSYWSSEEGVLGTDKELLVGMPEEDLNLTANFEEDGDRKLLHYWHFNTLDDTVTQVASDYSVTGAGLITYPGTGTGYLDERKHRADDPVSNMNLQLGEEPDQGAVLRARNPSDTRELIIYASSKGYQDIEVRFAVTRTSNGAQEQEFYFTADGGNSWVKVGESYVIPLLTVGEPNNGWLLKTFDLSPFAQVNDNDNLKFRVLFPGESAANTSGNNRFDNFSVHGTETSSSSREFGVELISIYPNPASTKVFINDLMEGSIVRIYNISGKFMLYEMIKDQTASIDISSLNKGVYILNIQENKTGRIRTAKLTVQ